MKCRACDRLLTDPEATNFSDKTKDYVDLCFLCLSSIWSSEGTDEHPVLDYIEDKYEQEEMAETEE